jgi:glyoxylase-like metal-dependent hydrolase (beta-lactamase superfamily II)
LELIDLYHLGTPHAVGSWLVDDVLIDCGPTSCLPRLLDRLGTRVPRALLLTHIHLDHAGAAGQLVKRWPNLPVYVHAIGAPHLVDPTRLLRSVERLYGDEMDHLWGTVTPVPEGNIRVLEGGETAEGLEVAYTPGHASHHVAFFDPESGRAFPGDVAGVRIPTSELIMPHAPPPDIDLEAWFASLDSLMRWQPSSLGLPHYGVVEDAEAHIATLRARLRENAELARTSAEDTFVRTMREELDRTEPSDRKAVYLQDSPPQDMYLGFRRYWDKRSTPAARST